MRQVLVGVLSIISANPGINQGKVGQALGIERGNMVSLANELEGRGLIRRTPVAANRRALSLSLTTDGQYMLENCLERIHAHENRLLADLSPDERTLLIHLLGRIERAI